MSVAKFRGCLLGAVAVAAIAAPLPALASGFLLKEQSASGQGTSFAGATANAAGDASALFFNPAAAGAVSGNQVVGVATGVFPYAKTNDASASRATRLGGGAITGSADSGDAAGDALVPAGFLVYSLTPDVKLGLALTSPWGLSTDYPENWVGRYHAVHSSLQTINISPSVSYKLLPELTVAAGLQIEYAKARLSQAVDFGSILAIAGARVAPGSLDSVAQVKGDDWGVGGTAGLLYQPTKETRIGLSYRSSVFHQLQGDATFGSVPAALRGSFADTDVKAKVTMPDVVGLGAYHELNDRWAVMGDVQWTNWSRFQQLRIDFANPLRSDSVTVENWKDSWFVSLGAAYKWSDKLTLRAGVAYDQSPVRDEYRTPRIPDADRYWVSLGAGYQVTDNIKMDLGYTHVFAHSGSVNLTDNLTGPDALRGNLKASYDAHVDIVALQTTFSF